MHRIDNFQLKWNQNRLIKITLLSAVYFFTAKFGLSIGAVNKFATLVWPPTGIALATLLILGLELWPGVLLGAFLVNWATGAPGWVALGMGIGNTLESVLGTYFLQRIGRFHNSMDRLKDVFLLLGFAAILSTALSATVGTTCLWLGSVIPFNNYGVTWRAWWIGDMLGDLLISPLLLTWCTPPSFKLPRFRLIEAILLILTLSFEGLIVFGGAFITEISPYPLAYPLFSTIIWSALRFSLYGTTAAVFATSSLAIWGTAHGQGPFVGKSLSVNLLSLQLFLGTLSLTGMVIAATITERKHIEEALRESEARLKRIVDANMIGIFYWDFQGTILDANDYFLKMVHYTQEDLKTQHLRWYEMTPPEFRARDKKALDELRTHGVCTQFEKEFFTQDGGRVPVIMGGALLEGRKEGVSFAIDSTERERLLGELLKAIQTRDEVVAVVSHDLKNPVSSILLNIQIALKLLSSTLASNLYQNSPSKNTQSTLHKPLIRIQHSAERMLKLIQDLLDVSKIEAGSFTLDLRPEPVEPLISEAIEILRPLADTKSIQLATQIDARCEVICDRERVHRVLSNLIGNAIKFTPVGGSITVKAEEAENETIFSVSDTGPGISEEFLSHIFERYWHMGETHQTGAGLGLFISKGIVDSHRGRIWVGSSTQGSTFHFSLPRA